MSWLRIEGKMPSHRKVAPLSDAAFRLHVTALAWCVEQKTNGEVPANIPATFPSAPRGKKLVQVVDELIAAGLWVHADIGSWRIHDFLEFNPRAEEVSSARREAGKRGARARWGDGKPDGNCHPVAIDSANGKGMAKNASDSDSDSDSDSETKEEEKRDPGVAGASRATPKARLSAKTRATALPEDWAPSPGFWDWVSRKRYARSDVERCAEAMALWARSNATRKADWDATLQGWVNREAAEGKVAIVEAPRPSRGLRDVPTAEELANVDHAAVAANIRAARERLRAHLVTPPDESPTLFADPATEVAQ